MSIGRPLGDTSAVAEMMSVFELSPLERWIGEFPCYLVRLVTLPGFLFLTEKHVCFYAALPGKDAQKTGYLSKKKHRTSPRLTRFYFELRNHVLSWYESAESKYRPLGTIHLEQIIQVEESSTKPLGIILATDSRRFELHADSDVSQKEWQVLEELQRAVFMAKNTGSTVRIVIPLAKITQIEQVQAFEFVDYLNIKFADLDEMGDQSDEYFFAFFPNISIVVSTLRNLWQAEKGIQRFEINAPKEEDLGDLESVNPGNGSTPSSVLALLVSAFTSPMTLLRSQYSDFSAADFSLFSGSPPKSLAVESATPFASDTAQTRSITHEVHNTLSKLPRAVSEAIHSGRKHDPQSIASPPNFSQPEAPLAESLPDTIPKASTLSPRQSTKKSGRFRSSSINSIRNFALRPFGFSDEKDPEEEKKLAHHRHRVSDPSPGILIPDPNSAPEDMTEQVVAHLYKNKSGSSAWTSLAFLSNFQKRNSPCNNFGINGSDLIIQIKKEDQDEQAKMNKQLVTHFAMLGTAESVVGVFNTALWKILPYYGKIYLTENYVCFHSRILAGRQKLIVPSQDIVNIRRLKSRGYYIFFGLGITFKNIQEEVYFEFSSQVLRDRCYAVLYLQWMLKSSDKQNLQKPISIHTYPLTLADILSKSQEHVLLPEKYNGPPLLSSLKTEKVETHYKSPKPMHITCLTIGSRGDVQPYIALCKQLMLDGHKCCIASHEEYKGWVEGHGIEFRSIGGDPGELMKLCIDNNFLSVAFIREGLSFFYGWFEILLETAWEACQGTDLLIESPSVMVGIHFAEKLGIPYFRSMPFPWSQTTRFPHPFAVQTTAVGRIYNDMTYSVIEMALWAGTQRYINRFRRTKLKLQSTTLDRLALWRVPHIYSFSSTIVSPPRDWPDYVHVTGYWFLDNPYQSWKPDEALVAFLKKEDQRPIVYIGFGSIIVPDPEALSKTLIEAVIEADVRAIISKGWSARSKGETLNEASGEVDKSNDILNEYPGTIFNVSSVPHDWLFPQIQGVVHHGGAGTTAAGLRAGLPTVIKPFFGDQRFWGQRVEELGIGVCISKLTINKLSDALVSITSSSSMIARAKSIGETIRAENGVKTAVECIYREIGLAKRNSQLDPEPEYTKLTSLLPTKWALWGTSTDENEVKEE
ncbi:hypothetical protein J3Q64DRAFT_1666352 [Phycomyces blakesleeanus]|uniref:sterol 3beta-glucosyltransferase n=2 Tax=Phycomyces blakesleeanus TaxID=4837 RepID=A0ABR3ALD6_PHYBL